MICEKAGRGVEEFGFGLGGLCILRGICKLNATFFFSFLGKLLYLFNYFKKNATVFI